MLLFPTLNTKELKGPKRNENNPKLFAKESKLKYMIFGTLYQT